MKNYKVYIAGKLNDDACYYIQNMRRMCVWAIKVKEAGFSVFVPALDFMLGFLAGNWEYKDYFRNNQAWLECAEAVFLVPGWQTSKGTLEEIESAKKCNIPCFTDIEELVAWRNKEENENTNKE